jgi:hypothetical protein
MEDIGRQISDLSYLDELGYQVRNEDQVASYHALQMTSTFLIEEKLRNNIIILV